MSAAAQANIAVPPFEPVQLSAGFTKEDLDHILMKAVESGASDINISTNLPVIAKLYGRLVPFTSRPLNFSEANQVVNMLYGENGMAILSSGNPVDPGYEILAGRGLRYRFRVNATARKGGVLVTIRTIPGIPPKLSEMGLPDDILNNIMPVSGIVLVVGTTGSGKSTLLASVIREFKETGNNLKIITCESPIEFDYETVKSHDGSVIVAQEEVGAHIQSFAQGAENALRQTPDIFLLGEARDGPSIEALLNVSRTGHMTMSTVHTGSVSATYRRLIASFPRDGRDAIAIDIIENLRLVVFQRLANSLDGKRIALREWLVFDEDVRKELMDTPTERVPSRIDEMVAGRKQSIRDAANRAFEAGLIDEATRRYSGGGFRALA